MAVLSFPVLTFSRENRVHEACVDTISASVVTADEILIATQTGLDHIDQKRILGGFALLSTPDVIKVIQTLPGVASGTELMSGLYVHGGNGSDNLFILDGVPLYQVSHLAGLFSSFNADVVDGVDFYKSGFPGRYGGRLSSVIDVKTRDGDFEKYHGTFSVGLIDGRLQFEGPVVRDRVSFNVAVRRSWLDALSVPGFAIYNKGRKDRSSAGYSFYDANASMVWKASDSGRLTARFYMGRDALKLYSSSQEKAYGAYDVHVGNDETSGHVSWGNILASMAWDGIAGSSVNYNVTAYYSRSASKIISEISDWSWDDEAGEIIASAMESNRSRTGDLGVKADVSYAPHKNHRLRMGLKCSMLLFRPETRRQMSYPGNVSEGGFSVDYTAAEAALYAEDEMTLTEWLKVNAGLRYAPMFVRGKAWHNVEPRVAVQFRCCDRVAIKASYTDMNQFAHNVATTYLDLPTNCWMPSTERVAPMHSRQVAAGVYSQLPYGLVLDVEGYYKTMDHLREYVGSSTLFPPLESWETDFSEGRGRAYGMEVKFGYCTPATDVSLYYTLSWSERHFSALYNGWYPDRNDNRHKITVIASHKFSEKFDVYAAWNYHSGGHMSVAAYIVPDKNGNPVEFFDRPNNASLPDYHRLDVGFNFHKKTKRGNESIWNLSIYNVYCRLNAVNAAIDKKEDGSYRGIAYGLVPIIPTFSYTLKFDCPRRR